MADALTQGLSHIMIGVTDMDRSIAFYEGTLGRPVRFRHEGFAFIDGGGVTIGLSRELGRSRQPLAGATELVFGVPDVKAAWRALAARGVAFIHPPRQINSEHWGASLADPDGHYVTLFGPEGRDA
jgi:catechol 2,3-dioxygenase-like lactoylglutathione lyase family enzyme